MNCKYLIGSVILTFFLCSSSLSGCKSHDNIEGLDSFLAKSGLRALTARRGTRTGAIYGVVLPQNLTGITVSILRLTGKSLWDNGASIGSIHIPPRTLSMPPVRRLAIVYEDIGNLSRCYFSIPSQKLISSVVGFRVFDVTDTKENPDCNVREIGVRMQNAVKIDFRKLEGDPDEETTVKARCVSFTQKNSEFRMTLMRSPGVCYGSSEGRFAVVVPSEKTRRTRKKRENVDDARWWFVVAGFAAGMGLVGFVGYVVVVGIRVLRTKKIQVMEKEADDGEIIQSRLVGRSKMPSASITRTQPENGLES